RYERSRESVLLKALGAARRQVVRITMVEYAFIGFFAALSGLVLAAAAAWAIARFVFESTLVFNPPPVIAVTLVIVVLAVGIGLVTSRGTYDQPVLSVLRAET
ncbi:MAG TPA: FtsX-like permease family protein, partial [Rhodothermales bacterium]